MDYPEEDEGDRAKPPKRSVSSRKDKRKNKKKKEADAWRFDDNDDEREHILKKSETVDYAQGRFRDPYQMSKRPEDANLACLEAMGKCKMTCCMPCNVCTKGSTKTITAGEAGIMLKQGIYVKTIGPGFYYYNDCVYNIEVVDLRVQTLPISTASLPTSEGLSISVSCFVAWRIMDPFFAKFSMKSITSTINQIAGAILKRVISRNDFKSILVNKEQIGSELQKQLNSSMMTGGVRVEFADITGIHLPNQMVEVMAQAAISKREAGAKKIIAEAEIETSNMLKKAGEIMNQNKNSINLKYFETLKEVATGWNHTVILPDGMVFVPTD
jgi:regulator of protease activity HflC (stomatin/prohibitin superfamily)